MKYEDIIYLPHPTSTKHPRMSLYDRAAQFSPFAALTGHSDAIKETARLTSERIELDEQEIIKLNEQIIYLKQHLPHLITVTYFRKTITVKVLELKETVKAADADSLYELISIVNNE